MSSPNQVILPKTSLDADLDQQDVGNDDLDGDAVARVIPDVAQTRLAHVGSCGSIDGVSSLRPGWRPGRSTGQLPSG